MRFTDLLSRARTRTTTSRGHGGTTPATRLPASQGPLFEVLEPRMLLSATPAFALGTGPAGYEASQAVTAIAATPGPGQTEIDSGQTIQDSVGLSQSKQYVFDATAGENILVSMSEIGGNSSFSPSIRVFSPNGDPLGSDLNNSVEAFLSLTAAQTGEHLIIAGDNNGAVAGGFNIALFTPLGDQTFTDRAGEIQSGETGGGNLPLSTFDIYSINLGVGDALLASMSEGLNTILSPSLRVYAPSGELLDVDLNNSVEAFTSIVTEEAGEHLIVAYDANGAAGGEYNFGIFSTAGTQVFNSRSGPIQSGDTAGGLLPLSTFDTYTIDLRVGDALLASMSESTNTSFSPTLRVYAPSGELLDLDLNNSVEAFTSIVTEEAGKHLIVAYDANGAAGGEYDLGIFSTAGTQVFNSRSGPIRSGEVSGGTLPLSTFDVYSIDLALGDALLASMSETTNTAFSPALRVYSPSGELLDLDLNNSVEAFTSIVAEEAGEHLIVTYDANGAASGDYHFGIFSTAGPQVFNSRSGPIANGEIRGGDLSLSTFDIYSFSTEAGGFINASMTEMTNTPLSPTLRLYNPDGTLLDLDLNNSTVASFSNTALQTGTHLLVAYDTLGGVGGQYNISVNYIPFTPDPASEVVNRRVFYNNSKFDNNNASANGADDNAVATDKQPLLPGQTADFDNYTSYSRGLNGVIVDIKDLARPGSIGGNDFTFRTGNDSTPGDWSTLAADNIIVRQGAGVGGSDRIEFLFDDNEVSGEWLQVTTKANGDTGLDSPDVFYFGNAPGETGDTAAHARVNAFDTGGVRDNARGFLSPAPINDRYDFNRDGLVNAFDFGLARDNATGFINSLKLINPPA